MNTGRSLTPGLRVIVVLGATATGKTDLAVHIARDVGGEVVSADSRYFYRGMDIGTAKPDERERGGIPHHLIDIREPWETYSLAAFLDDAYTAVEDVGSREHVPVVAGGTPQYLRGFIEGWTTPNAPPDEALRERLAGYDAAELHRQLAAVDPVSAARIGPHNKRRLIRALEVFETTGTPMSVAARSEPPPYRFLILGLTQPREALYARIDRRVVEMHAAGWLEEARALLARGVTPDMPAMSAHGYREALEVINGAATLEDAITRTQHMIHKYVRHQQTWFRRFENVRWFDSSEPGYRERALEAAGEFLSESR